MSGSGHDTVHFVYAKPLSYSGQSAASELIIKKLRERGWDCRAVHVYPMNRAIENLPLRYANFIVLALRSWISIWVLALRRRIVLHLNLGQSLGSLVRMGAGYIPVRILRADARVIISLHGSVFMRWEPNLWTTRTFRRVLNSAGVITVLSERQRAQLVHLGVEETKLRIVPNACEVPAIDVSRARAKHSESNISKPLRILHLSLLIESKGYPEFLEALEQLAEKALPRRIEAILCGPMAFTAHCSRFMTEARKEAWILDKLHAINSKPGSAVSVAWIRGAFGEEKRRLFEEAEIFVFPSRFPVEAQPLVLLEALAAGCVVITSTAGEIPSILNSQCALLLEEPSAHAIARGIEQLAIDPRRRQSMVSNGISLMSGAFSAEAYAAVWEAIFGELQVA